MFFIFKKQQIENIKNIKQLTTNNKNRNKEKRTIISKTNQSKKIEHKPPNLFTYQGIPAFKSASEARDGPERERSTTPRNPALAAFHTASVAAVASKLDFHTVVCRHRVVRVVRIVRAVPVSPRRPRVVPSSNRCSSVSSTLLIGFLWF